MPRENSTRQRGYGGHTKPVLHREAETTERELKDVKELNPIQRVLAIRETQVFGTGG